jgi:hypothetical protein
MASLVPCTVCRRHLRRHETQCRFCGAERTAEVNPREVALPRDVKRATLFALGLTLAGQACAETNDTPIYGAPFVGGSGGAGGGSGNGGGGAGGSAGAPNTSDGGSGQVQPVYGAPTAPTAGAGGAQPMAAVDAGGDAAADSGSDAGN